MDNWQKPLLAGEHQPATKRSSTATLGDLIQVPAEELSPASPQIFILPATPAQPTEIAPLVQPPPTSPVLQVRDLTQLAPVAPDPASPTDGMEGPEEVEYDTQEDGCPKFCPSCGASINPLRE